MRTETTTYHVALIGTIWMPAITCGAERTYRADDLYLDQFENEIDAVEEKLGLDTGDFQSVTDFMCMKVVKTTTCEGNVVKTRKETFVIKDWENEDHELRFMDSMYPAED